MPQTKQDCLKNLSSPAKIICRRTITVKLCIKVRIICKIKIQLNGSKLTTCPSTQIFTAFEQIKISAYSFVNEQFLELVKFSANSLSLGSSSFTPFVNVSSSILDKVRIQRTQYARLSDMKRHRSMCMEYAAYNSSIVSKDAS